MFEQSMIAKAPRVKRIWAASLGVTGQAMLVGAMILAPMLWPDTIPRVTFTALVPHAPPGQHPREKGDAKPRRAPRMVRVFHQEGLIQPRVIPVGTPRIEEQPLPVDTSVGVPYGTGAPGAGNGDGHFFDAILTAAPEPPKPAPVPRAVERPKPAEPVYERHKVGGVVREPKLIFRVDPRYPDIAVKTGISGVVRLVGVIGVDGRIRELSVVSGNPLLAPAALTAVRAWVYQPTLLNGDPIEVETEIVVTFKLGR